MEEKKKNKSLVIALIVFILLALGLSGYIVYDKVLSKDNNTKVEEKNSENEPIEEKKEVSEINLGGGVYSIDEFLEYNTNNTIFCTTKDGFTKEKCDNTNDELKFIRRVEYPGEGTGYRKLLALEEHGQLYDIYEIEETEKEEAKKYFAEAEEDYKPQIKEEYKGTKVDDLQYFYTMIPGFYYIQVPVITINNQIEELELDKIRLIPDSNYVSIYADKLIRNAENGKIYKDKQSQKEIKVRYYAEGYSKNNSESDERDYHSYLISDDDLLYEITDLKEGVYELSSVAKVTSVHYENDSDGEIYEGNRSLYFETDKNIKYNIVEEIY